MEQSAIALPGYERLVEELASVRNAFNEPGQLAIESKAGLKA